MGLFQKKHSIEDLNKITQKVLLSNSYSTFDLAQKDISPKFEKLKFHAPNKQVTKDSIQDLIDDLDKKKQEDLAQKKKEQEEQEKINAKKAEASQLKNETQGYKLNFVSQRDQLSKELLEIRNNRELLINEKIRPLESRYKKLVDDHKSIINIGNIFGDSSKISKNATEEQKKEIDEQQNKNYASNNGNYYEAQFKLLGNIKGLYDSMQQNKYLKQLQEIGEIPCAKIHDRKQALKEENKKLDEKLKEHYWFASNKQKDQQQKEKNDRILSIYNAMNSDKSNGGNFIWQSFEDNQKLYLSNKNQNKSLVGKLLSSEITSLYSNEALENEENELLNSTYFNNKTYNKERRKIIEEFEKNSKIIDEEDKKINEKEKEIEEKNKKIKDCDEVIKKLDAIINYSPSMVSNMVGSLINGAKDAAGFIGNKLSQNPISLINTIKNQNESIYKTIANPTVDIYKYLEMLEEGNGKKSSKQEGFYDFTQIARYKVFYDNCLKWRNNDCIQYYKYLYWVRNSDSQLDSYIDSYYDKTDDKSKALDLKNDMFRSTHIAKTSISYAKKCMEMGEKLCQDRLAQSDAGLEKVYKEIGKSINSIYIYIGGNSSKEIQRNNKNYNNIDKFKKLRISKKENTLKVYDENLGLITNFKRLSTSLGVDLYNINNTALSRSQKACVDLIKNIWFKQAQAEEFDKVLNERKTKIEKETNDIRDFTENQANQKGIMKSFVLPQLPQNNLNELNRSQTGDLIYYRSYFKTVMEIDDKIKKNFSNNRKLFKESPYFAKMWLESMRGKVRSLKETSELIRNQFETLDKTKNQNLFKETQKLYLKSKRQLEKYDQYFDNIESGRSIYSDMDISAAFSGAFWTDLRIAFNEANDLLQELGFEGRYKEIFRDISFTKVLRYSGTFIRFYRYWIDNISPQFLSFSSLFQGAKDKAMDAYEDSKLNQEGIVKQWKDCYNEFAKNINLVLFPEFFDNTNGVVNFSSILGVLKSPTKINKVINAFGKIDKMFYARQYEIKGKYEKQKENKSRMDSLYKQKLDLINRLNKQ